MLAARLLGASSLVAFGFFLLCGPIRIVDLGLTTTGALGFDLLLCVGFSLEHSGMVRTSFRRRLDARVPGHFNGAVYAICSGVALFALLLLWQSTEVTLLSAGGVLRWFLRLLFVAAAVCFVWGVRALGSMDAFGIRPIKAHLSGRPLREQPLKIRGPYRWVRHPLYTCVLVMLWSFPDLSADRLLLNASWTVWVLLGTILEERDLVAAFGDPYREYQRNVPMLFPLRLDGRE